MKKISFAALSFAITLLFTACRKEAYVLPETSNPYANVKTISVSSNQVAVKLVSVEGFTDYCFDMSVDNKPTNSFRFTGSSNVWNFQNMQTGLHLLSFACMHSRADDDHKEIMKFEINDGKNIQSVTVGETGHCKHDFWINISR